jgi:hypothetical protein
VKKVRDYREQAIQCRNVAEKTKSVQARSRLIQVAEQWEKLANEREKFLRLSKDR